MSFPEKNLKIGNIKPIPPLREHGGAAILLWNPDVWEPFAKGEMPTHYYAAGINEKTNGENAEERERKKNDGAKKLVIRE